MEVTLVGTTAVSYTHLDVYKRQAERLVTVGVEHPEASLWASDVRMLGFNIEFNLHGMSADESEAGEKILLGIAGDFNVENALVAIAAAREIGIGIEAIKKGLSKLRVPGRMEVVESKDGRVICVVDYAHNQLSFRSLFSSVKRDVYKRQAHGCHGTGARPACRGRFLL